MNHLLMAALFVMVVTGAIYMKRKSQLREVKLKNDSFLKDALFKAFFETSPTGMFLMDRDFRYQLVNPAHERSVGRISEDMVGRTSSEVVLDAGEFVTSYQQKVIDYGASFNGIEVSSAVDTVRREMRYWLSSYFPLYDAGGRISGLGAVVTDITERKKLENELKNGRDLLSLVLDNLPVGVWISNKQGEIIRSNKEALRLFGNQAVSVNTHVARFKAFWSETGKEVSSNEFALECALRNGKPSAQNQFDIDCLDGTRKSVINSAFPLIDEQGVLIGGVEINEDVTTTLKTQIEMRSTKELLQKLFDSPGVAIAITHLNGTYAKVNPAMCAFVGYPENELLELGFTDISHPDDMENVLGRRQNLLEGKFDNLLLEKRYIRKDGKEVWCLISVAVLRDEKGVPIFTIGVILDISHLKIVEASLLESQARLSNAQRMGLIGDWEWNFEQEALYCSDQIYAIYEMPLGSDIALESCFGNMGEFVPVHPDDKTMFSNYIDRRITQPGVSDISYRILLPDGRVKYLQDRTELIVDDSGKSVRWSGTVQDITEQKSIELDLLKTREHLRTLSAHHEEAVEESRKHMAREIHDELGQQLTALQMGLSVLRMDSDSPVALSDRIDELLTTVSHTMDVVRYLATNLRPAALDLGLVPAIEWLADDFADRWGAKCRVDVLCDPEDLGNINATAIFRIVQESLTNIVRHASASEVIIFLCIAEHMLNLQICDNGRGFDPEIVAKTSGFGLLGMRERVLALGGTMQIKTGPNQGTVINIDIPTAGKLND